MRLVYHGGNCCGIKTIHELGMNPSAWCEPLKKIKENDYDLDGMGGGWRFFVPSAPGENAETRIKRYIAWCEQERDSGVIEVVVADNYGAKWGQNQYAAWLPLLEELEFKEVAKFQNSNTDNFCYVFYRFSGQVPTLKFNLEK